MTSEINAQHNRIILDRQGVATVGQLAFVSSWQSFSLTERSVAVTVLKRGVILSVTQPGKRQAQCRPYQDILPVVFVVTGSGQSDD